MEARSSRIPASAREVAAEWHEGAFVGNWFVELTPAEATELGMRLLTLLEDVRRRPQPPPRSARALVSFSVLPWLDA